MFFWFLGILDNFPNFLFGASMDPSIVTACSSAAEGQSSWLSPKLCRVGVNVTGPIQHIINHICDRKDGLWFKKWNQSQNWSHILSISFLWYALCSTIFYHCKPRLSMSEASNASLQQIKLRSMQRKWIWRMSTRATYSARFADEILLKLNAFTHGVNTPWWAFCFPSQPPAGMGYEMHLWNHGKARKPSIQAKLGVQPIGLLESLNPSCKLQALSTRNPKAKPVHVSDCDVHCPRASCLGWSGRVNKQMPVVNNRLHWRRNCQLQGPKRKKHTEQIPGCNRQKNPVSGFANNSLPAKVVQETHKLRSNQSFRPSPNRAGSIGGKGHRFPADFSHVRLHLFLLAELEELRRQELKGSINRSGLKFVQPLDQAHKAWC